MLGAIRKRGLRKLEDVPMADTNLTGPASFLPTAEQDEQVRYYNLKLTQAMDYALPWEQANSDAEDRAARFLKHSKRLERKNNINNDVHFRPGLAHCRQRRRLGIAASASSQVFFALLCWGKWRLKWFF